MAIAGKTVLVTGASRGIGQALVSEALSLGQPGMAGNGTATQTR